MANYHPSDELLMMFAAGQQADALGILLACHVETCAACKTKAAMYEAVGGELITEVDAPFPNPGLLDDLLQKLDDTPPEAPQVIEPLTSDLPRPLHRFVSYNYADIPWRGFTRGIKELKLPISDDHFSAKFYKIAAGHTLPEHTHTGNEFTLVMTGAFADHTSEYRPGDLVLADETTIHQPRAVSDTDCICFAVEEGAIKMTGRWMRWLNPLLR